MCSILQKVSFIMETSNRLVQTYPEDCTSRQKLEYSWIFAAHQVLIDAEFHIVFGRRYSMTFIQSMSLKFTKEPSAVAVLKYYFDKTEQKVLSMPREGAALNEFFRQIDVHDRRSCFGVDYSALWPLDESFKHIPADFNLSNINWRVVTMVVELPSNHYGTLTRTGEAWTMRLPGSTLILQSWDDLVVACAHCSLHPVFVLYKRTHGRHAQLVGISQLTNEMLACLSQRDRDISLVPKTAVLPPLPNLSESTRSNPAPAIPAELSSEIPAFPEPSNSMIGSSQSLPLDESQDNEEMITESLPPYEYPQEYKGGAFS